MCDSTCELVIVSAGQRPLAHIYMCRFFTAEWSVLLIEDLGSLDSQVFVVALSVQPANQRPSPLWNAYNVCQPSNQGARPPDAILSGYTRGGWPLEAVAL